MVVDRAPQYVVAAISSTFEISSVHAQIAAQQTELTFAVQAYYSRLLFYPGWVGDLDFTDVPRGNQQLTITVVDVFSNTFATNFSLVFDGKPKLSIVQPAEPSIARPTLPIEASCSDDDGCSLSVRENGTPLPFGSSVDLSPFDHSVVSLEIRATDSAGQITSQQRTVYVESNPRLVQADSAPGIIVDVSVDRLLYTPSNGALAVLNRTSRKQTLIAPDSTGRAFLTPVGAVYVRQGGDSLTAELVKYPGGAIGAVNPSSLKVKGAYASWNYGSAGLFWQNTVTGANGQILQAGNNNDDVSENGAVAYWTAGTYQIYLNDKHLSGGIYPLTDGTVTAWLNDTSIFGSDGVVGFTLSKAHPFSPVPGLNYQVAGGWIAYTDIGNAGQTEIWLREPSGNRKKVSFLGADSRIDRLTPYGDVLFSGPGTRYLNDLNLGTFIGEPYFINDQWFVAVGPELFRLNTDAINVAKRAISVTGGLGFGDVIVGASKSVQMTIANQGTLPLTIMSIDFPPGFSGDWNGGVLPVNGAQVVSVTFQPGAAGNYGGHVTVMSDATEGTGKLEISGRGVAESTRIIVLDGNLAFGEVLVDSPKTTMLTISNTGNGPLQVQSINIPSGFSSDWSSGSILPGASQNVAVTFLPQNIIPYSGVLTVISDATVGTSSIAISGTGRSSGSARIHLSSNLGLGNVIVGTSARTNLQIGNTGEAPLTISQVIYPVGFTGDWAGGVIPPGGSHDLTVTFSPTSPQKYTGVLTVVSDASNDANTVQVEGTGIAGPSRILKLGGNLSFGSVPVGLSKTNLLLISSEGNSPLTILGISFPSGLSGNWEGGEIAAGNTRQIAVIFSPSAPITYDGNVIVNSDATGGNGVFAAFAMGVEPPADTRKLGLAGDLSYGNVRVGTSKAVSYRLSNEGNSPLTVTSLFFPAGFSGDWPGGVIPAGNSQTVLVTFRPAEAKDYGGSVTINSNATEGRNTISISGRGFLLGFAARDLQKPVDEEIHLPIQGQAGQTMIIEASADLKEWSELARIQSILDQRDSRKKSSSQLRADFTDSIWNSETFGNAQVRSVAFERKEGMRCFADEFDVGVDEAGVRAEFTHFFACDSAVCA